MTTLMPFTLPLHTFLTRVCQKYTINYLHKNLIKPARAKGLRAESARAFTGRRNSHSGRGEDLTASASMQQGHRKCDL